MVVVFEYISFKGNIWELGSYVFLLDFIIDLYF